jgi:SNF2 family DNA or RNA helicase
MLETLRCKRNFRGPFLVIAPVSTLGHWQREIESLTDMNCVVYTGTQEDRDLIRQYEFHFNDNSKALKFNVRILLQTKSRHNADRSLHKSVAYLHFSVSHLSHQFNSIWAVITEFMSENKLTWILRRLPFN